MLRLAAHATMRGVSEIRKRDLQGMIFINGIEFSCRTEAGKCHVLGYGYDPQSSAMRGIVETGMSEACGEDGKAHRLSEGRGSLTDEERKTLQPLHSKGKPHLAAILVKRGLARNNDEAIRECARILSIPETAESTLRMPSVPYCRPAREFPYGRIRWEVREKMLRRRRAFRRQLALLMSYGIRGLECYYSKYSPKEAEKLAAAAAANGLFVSEEEAICTARRKPGLPGGQAEFPR